MAEENKNEIIPAEEKVAAAKKAIEVATSADAKKKAGLALKEAKKELAAVKKANTKQAKYNNTCKGEFVLPGMRWGAGKSEPVPDDVAKSKKFKHAVKIGVLKKV